MTARGQYSQAARSQQDALRTKTIQKNKWTKNRKINERKACQGTYEKSSQGMAVGVKHGVVVLYKRMADGSKVTHCLEDATWQFCTPKEQDTHRPADTNNTSDSCCNLTSFGGEFNCQKTSVARLFAPFFPQKRNPKAKACTIRIHYDLSMDIDTTVNAVVRQHNEVTNVQNKNTSPPDPDERRATKSYLQLGRKSAKSRGCKMLNALNV